MFLYVWLLYTCIANSSILQTDKAAMLDEILDYVKFLRLQVKVINYHSRPIHYWLSNSLPVYSPSGKVLLS